MEKANKRVKNEPRGASAPGLALFAKFAAIQGLFNSPPVPVTATVRLEHGACNAPAVAGGMNPRGGESPDKV